MKLEQAVKVYQEYHKMNSGKNTIESYAITISLKVIELAAANTMGTNASSQSSLL